jgi:hypothetical protein
MKARLKILVGTLLLSSIAFSQTDTSRQLSKDSVVCLPVNIARQVAADLVSYDLCKEELTSAEQLNKLLNEKNQQLSKMFLEKDKQYGLCRTEVDLLKEKNDIYEQANIDLADKNRKLKNTSIALGSTTGIAVLVAVLLSILK